MGYACASWGKTRLYTEFKKIQVVVLFLSLSLALPIPAPDSEASETAGREPWDQHQRWLRSQPSYPNLQGLQERGG